jgi:hypothetical protein
MDKKPPSMVEFNFQDDKPIQEPLVLELKSDADDDDFESYEDELIHIEEKEKPNEPKVICDEKDIFENIPESPVAQHKPLDELKPTQAKQTKTKVEPNALSGKKPRKPMSEEHKQKLAIAREKAMIVRKQKAEEKKKMKALDNEEKELLKKQKFKKVQKLKEEVEDSDDKPSQSEQSQAEQSKKINNISGLTKKDLEDAQLEAIMKYDAMRKERKAKKKQEQIIEEGKNKMLNNIQRATGQYNYRDGTNFFDQCY